VGSLVRGWRGAALIGGLCLAFLAASPAWVAAEGDDDLALVRRAVASAPRSELQAPAPRPEPAAGRQTATRPGHTAKQQEVTAKPQERTARRHHTAKRHGRLQVSIEDRGSDGGSLSLQLPLSWLEAIGGRNCDRDGDEEEGGLVDLLEALRGAEPLVSIEGEDAHVRVWVE